MQLKATPPIGPRYWLAMAVASMCGANLGDIFMDILKLHASASLTILAILFALLLSIERATFVKLELFYWAAILIVRASATNISDFAIGVAHLTYIGTSLLLALILAASIALDRNPEMGMRTDVLPSTGGLYWFTMLIAGSLGTVIADGLCHAFGPVQTGVPVSAVMASVALLAVTSVRSRFGAAQIASYWITLVVIRGWGTNVGDICAYLLSLLASTAVTAVALTMLLLVWRTHRPSVLEKTGG